MNSPIFRKLAYLYTGSSSFDDDFRYYRDTLGAELIWGFNRFGARVAAFKLVDTPLVLLADHLPAPKTIPIFQVDDLATSVKILAERGWKSDSGPTEIPNGPCYVFEDPSGNRYGIFEDVSPGTMEEAYRDSTNTHRII